MAKLSVNGIEKEIDLVVFDKDGLMFKSQPFWAEIGNDRMKYLTEYISRDAVNEWAKVFGLTLDDNGAVTYCNPKGILAVAAPREEVVVTAGLIVQSTGLPWAKALEQARDVFAKADAYFDLKRALTCTKGFPLIFKRLREAGIQFAIATSDTTERAIASVQLFGEVPPEIIVVPEMVKKGKPAPDMLELAAKLAGASIEKTAMVGDSYVDVKMAHDAGGFGIGIPETEEMRSEMKNYTNAIIDSLDDILIIQ